MFSRLGMLVAGPVIAVLIIFIVFAIMALIQTVLDALRFFGWID